MTRGHEPLEQSRTSAIQSVLGPNFEAQRDTRAEDVLRTRVARATLTNREELNPDPSRVESERLLAAIDQPPDAKAGTSLASSSAMRRIRFGFLRRLHHVLKGYADTDLCTATVIRSTWSLTVQQLHDTSAAKIKNQFRADLQSVGVLGLPGPFVAVLHGEFDPVSERFQLHFHVLTTVAKGKALHKLKRNGRKNPVYRTTQSGAVPILVKPVRDRRTQFSYLIKSYWPSKGIREVDGVRKRDRAPQRIPEPFGTQVLLWLNRQKLRDLIITNDIWSLRSGGTAQGRDLYLFVMADW